VAGQEDVEDDQNGDLTDQAGRRDVRGDAGVAVLTSLARDRARAAGAEIVKER
jgi:hypothetical protein